MNDYIIMTRTCGIQTKRLSMTAYVCLLRKFAENTCIQEVARREDSSGMDTCISSSLPMFTARWFIPTSLT